MEAVEYPTRVAPEPELAIAILLGRLAWPKRLCDHEWLFGRSRSYISMTFTAILLHLHRRYHAIVEWHPYLDYDGIRSYAEALTKSANTVEIWGFIDGTSRPICRPGEDQEVFYSGYKKIHGIKFQGIATPDGLIMSCSGPYSGRTNDLRMFQRSRLEERLRRLFDGRTPYYLFRDSAYQSCYKVRTPLRRYRQLSAQELRYNQLLSSDRISVEQVFGRVLQQWHFNCLKSLHKLGLSPIGLHYTVAVLLTNCYTCLHGNAVSSRYGIQPLPLEQYLGSI